MKVSYNFFKGKIILENNDCLLELTVKEAKELQDQLLILFKFKTQTEDEVDQSKEKELFHLALDRLKNMYPAGNELEFKFYQDIIEAYKNYVIEL